MRIPLFWKLFAVQLLAAATLIAGVLLLARHQTAMSFAAYVEARERQRLEDVAERIAERYDERADLRAAALAVPEFRYRLDARPPRPGREGRPPRTRLRAPLSLLDADGRWIGGAPLPPQDAQSLRTAIEAERGVVGYLLRPPLPAWVTPEEAGFARRQVSSLLRITALSLSLAAVFAALSSALILRPIQRLSAGASALTRREFATRVDVRRRDELGQLADDFNRLAEALQRYDTQQRQWLADIAHELRTPVAVLRGELEALLDGVRSATPDTVRSLQQEVLRLGALIEDLHLLSLAESGGLRMTMEAIDLSALLRDAVARFEPRLRAAGFSVQSRIDAVPAVRADTQRIGQVFGNLLENVLRHARPGTLTINVVGNASTVNVRIEDDGPGVPADALPRLFDRLYRVQSARSRNDGGAGLGLAICRSIIEAQGGRISAYTAGGGGLGIHVELPVAST
ncbi:MAG: ATP-binding protein [Pseudomonadota bacterium]|nr:ATP-binding protein [Pseudomonadota bacterium]